MAAVRSCFLYLGVRREEKGEIQYVKILPTPVTQSNAKEPTVLPERSLPSAGLHGHSLVKLLPFSRLWGYLGHEEDRGTAESTWIAVDVGGTGWALQKRVIKNYLRGYCKLLWYTINY